MSSPRVVVLVHDAIFDCVAYTLSTVLPEAFRSAGAIVLLHKELGSFQPQENDRIISIGGIDDVKDLVFRFKPEHRWHHVIDVEKLGDAVPYVRATAYAQNVIGTKNLITTYETKEHMKMLEAQGFRHVTMPHCMMDIRPKVEKSYTMLVSGQMDMMNTETGAESKLYVTRTNVAVALMGSDLCNVVSWLQHPGHSLVGGRHDVVSEKYLQSLDLHCMGLLCKGSRRDSLVGKYVEFGACHVLPVGDCPTYMPQEMKLAMVDVERMTRPQIVAEIKRLLANRHELAARADAYVEQVRKHFLGEQNARRVMQEVCQ